MDVVQSAIAMRQAETSAKVQMAVAKKMLDSQRMEGSAAVKLIEAASEGIAKAGDELVAKSLGLGGAIDVMA